MLLSIINILAVTAWTPIGSIYNLPDISSIKISDKEYCIWKDNNNNFNVVDDICPHRLAPLSQGRVTGNFIECGYHGWKFNSNGRCISVPQEDYAFVKPKNLNINSYLTKQTGDILWACLDHNIINDLGFIERDDILMNSDITYIREVPYSWNYLLENFFDPAHIPFAHHGLQSFRDDATSIPIVLEKFTKNELIVRFKDITAGKKREGKIIYKSPYIYKLYKKCDKDKCNDCDNWNNDLTILCVPVTTGKSRVFMCNDKRRQPDMSMQDISPSQLRKKQHTMSSKFFNTDDYLVHKQEINQSKLNLKYNMPTNSDYSVKLIKKWMDKYHPDWVYHNTNELTYEQATDNYNNHISFCKDCNN